MSSTTRSTLAHRTSTNGESVTHLAALAADLRFDAPANIRRPQVAKHQPRTKAPAFDPALVSSTLSPNA